jgi:dolichol-phosphate mannosyltransferase
MFGKSTNSFIKNIGWAKKGIFSFSDTPLNILTATGVILLIISIIAAFIHIGLRLIFPEIVPKGLTTILILILFFGSINLFGIGLVGEYVSKIIVEVKGRPRLIRSSLIRAGKETLLLPDGKL